MKIVRVATWICLACTLAACSSSHEKLDLGGTCILNSDCNQGLVCTWGFCHVSCHTSADCQPGQSCIMASAQSTVCESPTRCIYNSECPTGLICAVDQQCRKQCQTKADCTSGQTCTTTQTCAELSQVDSNRNLFLPDGGVNGSGGASGAGGSGGSISPNPDAPPDLPADLSGSSGGGGVGGVTGTGTGGTTATGGSISPSPDAPPDLPADLSDTASKDTGGIPSTGGVPSAGGTISNGGVTSSGSTSSTLAADAVLIKTFDIRRYSQLRCHADGLRRLYRQDALAGRQRWLLGDRPR